jgi:hypothetical protein
VTVLLLARYLIILLIVLMAVGVLLAAVRERG